MKSRAVSVPRLAVGILVLSAVLSRTVSVLYSTAATDILYSESILPDVLLWLRQIFGAVSFGAGIAAVAAAAFTGAKKTAGWMAVLHIAVLFADALAASLIDVLSGAVSSSLLLLAMSMNLGDWLLGAVMVLTAYFLVRRLSRRGASRGRGVAAAALVYLIGRLCLRLFSVVLFLIDVDFAPYASELMQIAGELLQDVFLAGVAWLTAVGLASLYPVRDGGET